MMSGMAPLRPRSTRVTTDPDQYVRLRVVPGDLWRAGWVVVGVLAAASVLRWVLADGGNVIFTLVFSFIASVAMEPAVGWLSQHMSRGKAALLVMVGVGLAGLVFLVAFGRLLGEQIATFATTLPDLAQSAVTWVNQRFGASISYQDVLDKLGLGAGTLTSVATSVAGGLLGFVIQVLSAAFGTLTFAFFTFYFSADAPRLRNWMAQLFPPDRQEIIDTVWSLSVRKTGGYVAARLVLAAVCGGAAAIFMLIIGMPYWLALGIWTGVVAQFVPTVGTYIAIALPVLIGLVGPQPWQGVAVLAFALVYQQIENVTLEPRISASAVDVHPAVSFAAVMFGASLFGVGGAFVAVPMAALMLALFDIYANKYEVAELDDAVFAPPEGDESDADEAAAPEAREA